MGCKHRILKQSSTNEFEYMCRAKDKTVSEYSCSSCPLKIEDNKQDINDLFGSIFGKGFSV